MIHDGGGAAPEHPNTPIGWIVLGRKGQDTHMTRLVIEQGPMAASRVALVHGGKPAVAASVHALDNRCGTGRRVRVLPRGIRRSWQPTEDQGHTSPLAGAFYSVPAKPSSDLALG